METKRDRDEHELEDREHREEDLPDDPILGIRRDDLIEVGEEELHLFLEGFLVTLAEELLDELVADGLGPHP